MSGEDDSGRPGRAVRPNQAPHSAALGGQKPGNRRVRVERPQSEYFRYTPSGALEARPKAHEEKRPLGRGLAAARRANVRG